MAKKQIDNVQVKRSPSWRITFKSLTVVLTPPVTFITLCDNAHLLMEKHLLDSGRASDDRRVPLAMTVNRETLSCVADFAKVNQEALDNDVAVVEVLVRIDTALYGGAVSDDDLSTIGRDDDGATINDEETETIPGYQASIASFAEGCRSLTHSGNEFARAVNFGTGFVSAETLHFQQPSNIVAIHPVGADEVKHIEEEEIAPVIEKLQAFMSVVEAKNYEELPKDTKPLMREAQRSANSSRSLSTQRKPPPPPPLTSQLVQQQQAQQAPVSDEKGLLKKMEQASKPSTQQVSSKTVSKASAPTIMPPQDSQKGLVEVLTDEHVVRTLTRMIQSPSMKPVLKDMSEAVICVLVNHAATVLQTLGTALKEAPELGQAVAMDATIAQLLSVVSQSGKNTFEDEQHAQPSSSAFDRSLPSAPFVMDVPINPPNDRKSAEVAHTNASTNVPVVPEPVQTRSSAFDVGNYTDNGRKSAPFTRDDDYPYTSTYEDEVYVDERNSAFPSLQEISKGPQPVTPKRPNRENYSNAAFPPANDFAAKRAQDADAFEEYRVNGPTPPNNHQQNAANRFQFRKASAPKIEHQATLLPGNMTRVSLLSSMPHSSVMWTIKNTGLDPWPSNLVLISSSGNLHLPDTGIRVKSVGPGDIASVRIQFEVLMENVTIKAYEGRFQLYSFDTQEYFGDFQLSVTVDGDTQTRLFPGEQVVHHRPPPRPVQVPSRVAPTVNCTSLSTKAAWVEQKEETRRREELAKTLSAAFQCDKIVVEELLEISLGDGNLCAQKLEELMSESHSLRRS